MEMLASGKIIDRAYLVVVLASDGSNLRRAEFSEVFEVLNLSRVTLADPLDLLSTVLLDAVHLLAHTQKTCQHINCVLGRLRQSLTCCV